MARAFVLLLLLPVTAIIFLPVSVPLDLVELSVHIENGAANNLLSELSFGARAVAVNLYFIATAKRYGINTVDWYADVLARINGLKTSELQQLLPQNCHLKEHESSTGHALRKSDSKSFRYHVEDWTDPRVRR